MNSKLFTKKTIILIVSFVIFIVTALCIWLYVVPLFSPEHIEKEKIKEVVSEKIGRQDITIDEVIIDEDGWQLAKVNSTRESDKGNSSLAIVQKTSTGEVSLKFGPGTSFEKEELVAANVPESIQNKLFKNKNTTDPIISYLPRRTNFYSVELGGVGEFDPTKRFLRVTIYEVPRYNIYATKEKKDQYTVEINDWIRSLGLDPEKYTLAFTK